MTTILTCPDGSTLSLHPSVLRSEAMARVYTGKGIDHFYCVDDRFGFVVPFEITDVTFSRDYLSHSDFNELMPVVLIALVTALGFRWFVQLVLNKL